MRRWFIVAVALLWCVRAEAQECVASLSSLPAGWSAVPIGAQPAGAALERFIEVACRDCKPVIAATVSAGPAPSTFRNRPIGQKAGREFADAVVSDTAERLGFLESVLRSERMASPGCTIDGQVEGVAMATALPTIITNIRAECSKSPAKVSGVFYSGYDGRCLYQAQVTWSPWIDLSIEDREHVLKLLKALRFGP